MKVLILEDNAERRSAMEDRLKDRFPFCEIEFFTDAPTMIQRVESAPLDDVALISLDHDLEMLPGADVGALVDPGTGVDVAEGLSRRKPVCLVIVHTTNTIGGDSMQEKLDATGWTTLRVTPYGDLDWIDEMWFPAVRNSIVRDLPERSAATQLERAREA
ncbi:MAG: cyclic-phosphate processing receiver domain-containing protein [Pirellulales bacterium]